MGTATFSQSNFEVDGGTQYKTNIDNDIKVFAPFAGAFAVHEQSSVDMTVRIDSGQLLISGSLFLLGVQNTVSGAILAPSANPRRDLITINMTTGSAAVQTGAEAASPVDPAVNSGFFPVARISATVGMTTVPNTIITDLRPHHVIPAAASAVFVPSESTEAQARTAQVNSVFLSPRMGLGRTGGIIAITASETIVSSANGQLLTFSNSNELTFTLPTNATASLSPGFQFAVMQAASGQAVFAAQSGTTLRSYNGANQTAGLYAIASVVKDVPGSGDWFLAGNVSSG